VKEFWVNNFITLRLEEEKTVLYVNRKPFLQCKYLLLFIPIKNDNNYEEIDSIDEASEILDRSMERSNKYDIPPETEFWGHCSNLQAWVENDYDSRLLHSNLAFPLLKELVKLGDKKAQSIFSEEIAMRFERGYFPVIEYLINEGYLNYLSDDQFLTLIDSSLMDIPRLIEEFYESERQGRHSFKIYKLFVRIESVPSERHKSIIIDLYKSGNYSAISYLNEEGYNEEIGRATYYDCLLEKKDSKAMLKLESLLQKEFWIAYDLIPDEGLAIEIKERRIVGLNISSEKPNNFLKPILDLKGLKKLFYCSDLRLIPEDIDKLQNLELLDLEDNCIEVLPKSLWKIKSLRVLNLGGNPLKEIPKSPRQSLEINLKK